MMLKIIILVHISMVSVQFLDPHPELNLKIANLLDKYGYPLELHEIQTEDDYILTTHRIPHGRSSNKTGAPIILVPGTGGSAENFLILGNSSAIAYYLADRGYDVWLMNTRGTRHSRKHVTLNADTDREYWDFSFHEVGVYDIPANVDYIYNLTRKNLFYVGHSQGTSTFFVFTSEKPEYNEKINLSIHFGYSVFIKNVQVPFLQIMAKYNKLIEYILKWLNIHFIMPDNENLQDAVKELCSLTKGTRHACAQLLHLLDAEEISTTSFNESFAPIILRDSPAGSSIKQIMHYAQLIETGQFQQYDYGIEGNLRKYRSTSPPVYDLSKCTSPVALFEPSPDFIVTNEGREMLFKALPNIVFYRKLENFHHADFIWGQNVTQLVNKPVLRLLRKFDPSRKTRS